MFVSAHESGHRTTMDRWLGGLIVATVTMLAFVGYSAYQQLHAPSTPGPKGPLAKLLNPPTPLEKAATRGLMAKETGDGKVLYDLCFPQEKQRLDLTPAKISQIYRDLVLPRFAMFKKVGEPDVSINSSHDQAFASQKYMDAQGHTIDMDCNPFYAPGGGYDDPMQGLSEAWILEYQVAKGIPGTTRSWYAAQAQGLRHDRAYLERLGVNGLVDMKGNMDSWDRLLVAYDTIAATGRPPSEGSNKKSKARKNR
ncbi:MAG: hypothetical protein JSS72_08255 [Armatimonadetes bacterium]|nr:hypothetical protein [Armatimonadota bacterium]